MSSFVSGVESGSVESEAFSVTDPPEGALHSTTAAAPEITARGGLLGLRITNVDSPWCTNVPPAVAGNVVPSVTVMIRRYVCPACRLVMSEDPGRPGSKGNLSTSAILVTAARSVESSKLRMVRSVPPTFEPYRRTQTAAGTERRERSISVSNAP